MNGQTYADLLQRHLMPFIETTFGNAQNCILQDDNAPAHRSAVVAEKKRELGLRTLRWPSRSADMNPIEYLWSFLKRQTLQQNPPPIQVWR